MSAPTVPLEGYAYIECRDLRHAWTVVGWFMGTDDRMKRRCKCVRCPTMRIETIEGWVTRRSYEYPDDYHLDHRPSIAEVREEARSRATVFTSEEELEKHLKRERTRSRSRLRKVG
jgi:hypothetical protein